MPSSAKIFQPGLPVFLSIIVCWICQVRLFTETVSYAYSFQVQCLMLIIVNRLCILYSDSRQRRMLRFGTAGIVTVISLSTACIWIPAQLQINHTYIWLNHWWDRFENLNILFIRVVKTRLINYGLKKYDRVMKFNQYIIFVSIGMDILLLGVTALHNGFVYTQFHPVVYIVKLHIEVSMSQLLIKVARSTGINVYNEDRGRITSDTVSGNKTTNNVLVHSLDYTLLLKN
ncbi:hypothetical protein BDZ89DRAFT_943318 [Hymenopellis radicata]|nr:hypothetical protein BDZ89DRAFT_943318 [Hymenopellis radicata]